jgi:hypothetical protein
VEDDHWQCPRHYCAAGMCQERPYFYCDFCTTSFCKPCAVNWGKKQGGRHQYIEIALLSEYCGDEANPTAPNSECMRIICDMCIDMGKQCIARGGVAENMVSLFNANAKSFDPNSELYFDKPKSSVSNYSGNVTPPVITEIPSSSSSSSPLAVGGIADPHTPPSVADPLLSEDAAPAGDSDTSNANPLLKVPGEGSPPAAADEDDECPTVGLTPGRDGGGTAPPPPARMQLRNRTPDPPEPSAPRLRPRKTPTPPKKLTPRKTPTPPKHKYIIAMKKNCIGEEAYWGHIGRSFIDAEEQLRFTITGICQYNKHPGVLFYEYVSTNNMECPAEMETPSEANEHSSCAEIVKQEWCQWCE